MLLAFMKKLLQSRRVLLARLRGVPALLIVRGVQRVLLQELFGLPEIQIVRIFFDYNYI